MRTSRFFFFISLSETATAETFFFFCMKEHWHRHHNRCHTLSVKDMVSLSELTIKSIARDSPLPNDVSGNLKKKWKGRAWHNLRRLMLRKTASWRRFHGPFFLRRFGSKRPSKIIWENINKQKQRPEKKETSRQRGKHETSGSDVTFHLFRHQERVASEEKFLFGAKGPNFPVAFSPFMHFSGQPCPELRGDTQRRRLSPS